MPVEFIISMAASVILAAIKNSQHREAFKSVMLKIYKTIKTMYAGDPDFAQVNNP